MSVARKRAKVKKKRSAAAKRPRRTAKKKASVNTKKRRAKPKPRRSKRPGIASKAVSPKPSKSQAAKKGWETRRRKQAQQAAEYQRLQQEAQSSIDARLAFLRLPQVAAQIRDQLIRTELIRPGMVQTEETMILSTLITAEQLGNFDETARALAVEYDWDIRDIYTLWKSP